MNVVWVNLRGLVPQLASQPLPELHPGTEEPDFDVRYAQAQDIRSRLGGHPFDIPQDEHHPVLVVQLGDGTVE